MTDEMTIKQRPSALPYVGIGGALGAGAGYLVNEKFISKPMTHEDIVAKMNDAEKQANKEILEYKKIFDEALAKFEKEFEAFKK